MSFPLICLILAILLCVSVSPAAPAREEPADLLATLQPSHPRLLASRSSWEQIKLRRRHDAMLDSFLRRSELEARALLEVPPIAYKKDGRRLLHVSRVVLRRTLLLALHFHLTGDAALSKRAREEMLSAAAFSDWNPSHFLDTAEMTAALALGYDWLYDQLDGPARQTIAAAMVEKGLRPGSIHDGWKRSENNWNQVCLAGLSLGALAVAENEPVLAAQTLQKAKDFNAYGLKPYAPDGVYPEGGMYWNYGTSFQVLLLSALETALGTDWDLSQSPGFLPSAAARAQTIAPSGLFFNFADGGERVGMEPTLLWFAQKLKQPELAQFDRAQLQKYAASTPEVKPQSEDGRLLPLAALWWPDANSDAKPLQSPLAWLGRGANPLAIFRTAWNDPNAMFLGLKGGRAAISHGHMDAGSFVFESDGVRWARDLGRQDYLSLESKGIDLWNSAQNGGRWSVFRLNNFSHNTLTINNQLHQVNGHAEITHFSDGSDAGAIVDLSPVFAGQASRVSRGFAFRGGSHALIRDEIEGLKAGDEVRWAMLTSAEIAVSPDGLTATLTQSGKTVRVTLHSSVAAKFEIISADPPHDYDAPNPNSRFLIVNLTAPGSGHLAWSVMLLRASNTSADEPLAQTALKKWPFARST